MRRDPDPERATAPGPRGTRGGRTIDSWNVSRLGHWPACHYCGGPAHRTLVAVDACFRCVDDLLAPLRACVAERDGHAGIGLRVGEPPILYSDPRVATVRCDRCGASWDGRPGESCGWCFERLERMLADQRRLLLAAELPGRDDHRHAAAVRAWIERLALAVRSGVINEADAHGVIARRGIDEGARHVA